jgi:hypothetical protein
MIKHFRTSEHDNNFSPATGPLPGPPLVGEGGLLPGDDTRYSQFLYPHDCHILYF